MLKNAYFFANIGANTAENERNFAENLPIDGGCRLAGAPRRLRVPVAAAEVHDLGGAGERPEKTREYSWRTNIGESAEKRNYFWP